MGSNARVHTRQTRKRLDRLMIKYKDQKTTIFSNIANIVDEGDYATPLDIIDFMIEIMSKDQLNQVEDMITNRYPEEDS